MPAPKDSFALHELLAGARLVEEGREVRGTRSQAGPGWHSSNATSTQTWIGSERLL